MNLFDGVQMPASFTNALENIVNARYSPAFDASRDQDTTTPEAQKVALYAHALAVVRDPEELQEGFQGLLVHIEKRALERLKAETDK